jgi:beta-glucanase (GH16 family)
MIGNKKIIVLCVARIQDDATNAYITALHNAIAGNGYNIEEVKRSQDIIGDAQYEYHTFAFEWDETSMSFSVDGTVYYTALRSQMENFDITGYDTNSDGIFNQPLCIRVNNHMYPSANGIDTSLLDYEIDYIRLYQKNDGKSEITFR